MHIWKHFRTIHHHKMLVMKGCFKVGLYRQGLMHDLSKYSPVEFWNGCRYYRGTESPNNEERRQKGYSAAWLHHKGRNKHHMEYWIDYGMTSDRKMCGMKMPLRYVVEMVVDRISASKNYLKDQFQNDSPLQYYENSKDHYIIHPDTNRLLGDLLRMYAEKGEEETFSYIKNVLLKQEDY
ncbi:MAG: DUF5662 family protein [Lachnospiraceae bacterium]